MADQTNIPSSENLSQPNNSLISKTSFWKKHQWELSIITIVSSFLIAGILFLVISGNYKYYFKSQVEGQVVDENSKPIDSAKIKIDDIYESQADINGYFKFDSVPPSSKKIVITSPKHFTFEDKLALNVGNNNNLRYKIKTLDYATISGKLIGPNLQLATIKITLDDTQIPLASDYTFSLDKAKLGQSNLKIVSTEHKDILNQLTLEPGLNALGEIKLELGKETTWHISNWANSSSVVSAKIQIGATNLISDEKGNFSYRLSKGEKTEGIINANGFISKTFDLTEDVSQLELVPEGNLVYTSNRDGKDAIYVSNYDGTGEKKIYTTKGSIGKLQLFEENIYFVSNQDQVKIGYNFVDQVYKINYDGSGFAKVSNLVGGYTTNEKTETSEYLDLASKRVLYSQVNAYNSPTYFSKVWTQKLDGSDIKIITEKDYGTSYRESVYNYAISAKGDKIAYLVERRSQNYDLTEERVEVANIDGTNSKEIYLGANTGRDSSAVLGFNKDSTILVYQLFQNNNYDIFTYNLSTSEIKKIGSNGSDQIFNQAMDNLTNRLYYSNFRDSQVAIYFINIKTGELSKVSGTESAINASRFNIEAKFGMIYFEKDSKMNLIRPSKVAITLPVSTNFNMWGSPGGYYGRQGF